VLGLVLFGCGGAPAQPPPKVAPRPAPKPQPVVEVADLSPVVRPDTVFVAGRVKRPTALTDTVAHWAGVPLGLRDVLPFAAQDLDSALVWDAPVELAVALAPSGGRGVVEAGISLGLSGTEQALAIARKQGYEVKRLGPEIYGIGGTRHFTCAVAPALGSTPARLVCAHRSAELEDLLPYMTRGLPSEPLGQRDLEVELKVEPLRKRFATELGSARLFAGFLVRELAQDAPRFDTALSDAAFGLADELVAVVRDVDSVRLEGTVDDKKREVDVELSLVLGDKKSWSAGMLADRALQVGGAPEAFFNLPGDAAVASFQLSHQPSVFDKVSSALVELGDAYLEHKKVGKATRERVARLIQGYFAWDGLAVSAEGHGSALPPAKGGKPSPPRDWQVMQAEHVPPALRTALADVAAVLSDRELRAVLARALDADEKELPTAKLVPLRGPGVPARSQALVISAPSELGPLVGRSFGLGGKGRRQAGASERVVTLVPRGSGAVFAIAESTPELAARVAQALSSKGSTLATRAELAPLRSFRANNAGFVTLLGLLGGTLGRGISNPEEVASGLPNHARVPIFLEATVEQGAGLKAIARATIPAGVFEDLPGLLPVLAASVMSGKP
jgi:hypothetical protein